MQLRAVGIALGGLYQIGLGVHLDQVVDLGVIGGIARDKTALAGKHAAHALGTDLEQMLGIEVGDIDSLAIEVAVHMLDLLIAGEQHQTTGAVRGGHVVVDVRFANVGRDVDGHLHLITGDLGHGFPPKRRFYLGAPPNRAVVRHRKPLHR